MSTSLVKLSLSLFGDDIRESDVPKKKKNTKDPMSLISSRKIGVKKELKKLERKRRATKKVGINQNSSQKYDEQTDYTEESVQALRRISQIDSIDQSVTKSVLNHHHKGKLRQQELKQMPGKEEESTLFTDKDFEDFCSNYDFTKHKTKS